MNSTSAYIFCTTDIFGNTVTLTRERWHHIVEGHKEELAGLQRAVQLTVQNPTVIYESTANSSAFIFHGHGLLAPRSNIVRVIMRYDDTADIREGGTEGHIVTAFTPSPRMEFVGQLGPVYYERPRKK